MDYGELVSGAWRITWRNRGLWWVGLFAGTASGSCSTGFNSGGDAEPLAESFSTGYGFDPDPQAVLAGLQTILPALMIIGAILFVVVIGFWLLSVACTAAVILGGREEAAGRPITVGVAWSRGMYAFGRLLRLQVLWLLFWVLVVAVIVVVAIAVVTSQPADQVDWLRILFSLLGVLAVVGILGSLLGIVLAYAQRAIVLEGDGAIAGLKAGLGLTRAKFGTSLLVWLIGVALAIGGGIALLFGLAVVALPTLLIGAILGLLASLVGVPLFVIMFSLLGLVLTIALVVGAAGLNTYIWHYWTLAYLRLAGEGPAAQPTTAEAA